MTHPIGQLMDLADALSSYVGPVHAFRTMGGVELMFGTKPTPVLTVERGHSGWRVWRFRPDGGVDIWGEAPRDLSLVRTIAWCLARAPGETLRAMIERNYATIPPEVAEFLIARAAEDDRVLALPVELHVGGLHEGTVELRHVRDELTDAELRSLFVEGGVVHGETTVWLDA